MINNVLYVIILSAALDLVGPSVPKAVVLLADVLPSFFVKLLAPYFIHHVSYPARVVTFASLSTVGMLMVAFTSYSHDEKNVGAKLAGVVLASLSGGGGELSFLALTHYYGQMSLAAWGSGTGGAGLVGASAYVIATTTFGLSVPFSMLLFSVLPIVMLVAFFVLLPRGPLNKTLTGYARMNSGVLDDSIANIDEETDNSMTDSRGSLLTSTYSLESSTRTLKSSSRPFHAWKSFQSNLRRARVLVLP